MPNDTATNLGRTVAELRRELAARTAERNEALAREAAMAEVLQVVNSSPGDLAPVFDAILEKAHKLCGAAVGSLGVFYGDTWRAVVQRGYGEPLAGRLRQPSRGSDNPLLQQLIDGARLVHVPDLAQLDLPIAQVNVAAGIRTLLVLPLRKDDALLGTISTARREVRPFSDREIALLKNFAAQAVTAIENARLSTETREALEQQTATAEVLQVINSSPRDLVPVFDAVLDKALALCGAAFGVLWRFDRGLVQAVAIRGATPEYVDFLTRGAYRPDAGSANGRLIAGANIVHQADVADTEDYRSGNQLPRTIVDLGGGRTLLAVALRREETFLGSILIYRREVRPFADNQIALLQNFAAQAVIAIENARLLTETREALAQQTATAEVLQVINSSPGNLAPVFDGMLEKALTLCDASFGQLVTFDGVVFRAAAWRGYEPGPSTTAPTPGMALHQLVHGEQIVHIPDITADDVYRSGNAVRRRLADEFGGRTAIWVALRKDSALVGAFVIYRTEVRPFTDKQIALLQNFAAQAVIAMENARLLTETREALEQQTATSEVLQVINTSPGDLAPVFDAMLEKATDLCQAALGVLWTYDGELFRAVATRGAPPAFAEFLRESLPVAASASLLDIVRGHSVVHVPDLAASKLYEGGNPVRRAIVDLGGARTLLSVGLRKDNALLGAFNIYRREVRPFSDKQIALAQNFADQAVIAMENARLLSEIRQRQAELRVTFDNMGDGVAMFDGELRLAAWNLNFQRILDLPDAVLAERPSYADYIRILAERGEFGADDIDAELSRRLAETDQDLRLERTRPDGRVIEVRKNAVPGGGFVLIYSDITERKRAEAEIRAARDTAQRALRELQTAQASLLHAQKMAALGQLTAGIAHEIKNPLNFVNNFADLSVELLDELKETAAPAVASLGEDARAEIDEIVGMLTGNLEKIGEHGRRADGIVKSMLAHSRGGSGDWQSIDINALAEEALNLAYHGARAQDQNFNITLEPEFDRSLTPIELVPQDVTRVLLNLFGNGFYAATKKSREMGRHPVLKVTTKDLGESVEIRVHDNGTGIPPEFRAKLFQPFFTTKPTGEGTGLGLSISYDIITQQHGGTIEVDSVFGEFTEFTIHLPRRAQP
jgi:GAF domain-containing protein